MTYEAEGDAKSADRFHESGNFAGSCGKLGSSETIGKEGWIQARQTIITARKNFD